MALSRFDVVNAKSFAEASELLQEGKGKTTLIAGGTDLLHGYKDHIYADCPTTVVNLRSADEGRYIQTDEAGVHIGSLTTLHEMEMDEMLNEQYSVLAQAAYTIASPQIRNNATIGGNICQEPRCWYYRNAENTFECLRKGGQYCNAMTGRNEIHSIFGPISVKDTSCSENCPACNHMPEYFEKLREDDYDSAAKILIETNPLAAITGRVCPHTCQEGCNRAEFDKSVSIRSVERAVGDYMLEHADELYMAPQISTGKKIAVVGSGPAGLTTAYFLRKQGHSVCVFDKMPKAGGMLRYGIPAYRLQRDVLDKQIQAIADMGVEFVCNAKVGDDIKLSELRKEYDAVFLGPGCWSSLTTNTPGEENSIAAIQFLQDVELGKTTEKPGDKVIVVGGGSVALDAATTAKRMGAENVTVVYRRTRNEMPAEDAEMDQAVEEGVEFKYLVNPCEIVSGNDGNVSQVKLQVMELSEPDESGRCKPVPVEGKFETLDADCVIMGIGQRADLSFLEPALNLNGRTIESDEETQETPVESLYAGGDAASGPSTVVKAIAAGRRAASAMNQKWGLPKIEYSFAPCGQPSKIDGSCICHSEPAEMAVTAQSNRSMDKEDALGLTADQVKAEVNRCLHCGCVAACPSDLAPALVALSAQIKTTKRIIDAEQFFSVGIMSSTVLEPGELVTEVIIPPANKNTKSVYMKYRHRKAIDFPLLSVAVAVTCDEGCVSDARIVLGAAAPIPLRAKEAEKFLVGKALSEDVIAEAGELAIKNAQPLGKNYYKVVVAREYVKRALMQLC